MCVESLQSTINDEDLQNIHIKLRDIYSICRCCWNGVTYEWKVHNGKIEIIFFVVKLHS
jgi:hypothetical protein